MGTDEELEKLLGVASERSGEREEAAVRGESLGKQVGEGKSPEPDEALVLVGFEATPQEVAAMDKRATELGMSRSDYLRSLVRKDLATS